MINLPSKSDIEKISLDVLKQSKSLDVFPTPVDNILNYSQLRLENRIDLSQVDQSFLSKFSDNISRKFIETISLVRGLIDRREKTIYLDLSQNFGRQNFVKLHEVEHDVLYWQKEILEHIDNDLTLDASTKEEFEAEANYFASATLFQHDRFENEMRKLELGIKSPMALAKQFGASKHATLRKYVECSKNRCALLVLERDPYARFNSCLKRDYFQSDKFTETFGAIELPTKFGYTWQFTKDFCFGKKYHETGSISLDTQNGVTNFKYHFFNNSYNAFVFIFPEGEVNKTRTKIIVSDLRFVNKS